VVSSLNIDFGIGIIAACWIAALSLELNKPSKQAFFCPAESGALKAWYKA
jgi:hypothetical protein